MVYYPFKDIPFWALSV